MWDEQAEFQQEIGLDPRNMTDADKAAEAKNLLLNLSEEGAELARVAGGYKRHILHTKPVDRGNVAIEVVDGIKCLLTLAQLFGVGREELVHAFHEKTNVLRDRAEADRLQLERETRVVCVDLDDCVCDLSEWPKLLDQLQGGVPRQHHKLLEEYKDDFHSSGRFRELPVIEGAQEALVAIKRAGFTIVIVTARPVWQFKRIYADTLHWLDKHNIPRDLLLFNKDKVEAIHRDLRPAWPVAFIEDHPRNALALASANVPVLLYEQEYNANVPEGEHIQRVRDWNDILLALNAGGTPR